MEILLLIQTTVDCVPYEINQISWDWFWAKSFCLNSVLHHHYSMTQQITLNRHVEQIDQLNRIRCDTKNTLTCGLIEIIPTDLLVCLGSLQMTVWWISNMVELIETSMYLLEYGFCESFINIKQLLRKRRSKPAFDSEILEAYKWFCLDFLREGDWKLDTEEPNLEYGHNADCESKSIDMTKNMFLETIFYFLNQINFLGIYNKKSKHAIIDTRCHYRKSTDVYFYGLTFERSLW